MDELLYKYLKYMGFQSKGERIFLCRHGETVWNTEKRYQGRQNSELTQLGIEHAEKVGNLLLNKNVNRIISSPLGRANATAKICAKITDAKLIILPEIMEQDFGKFEGQARDDMVKKYDKFYSSNPPHKNLFNPYPDGESNFQVWLRLLLPLLSHVVKYKNFAIIGHGCVNRIIRSILLGIDIEEGMSFRQDHDQILEIDYINQKETLHKV